MTDAHDPSRDCEMVDEAGAYVLGALEELEAARFTEHLQTCAICSQEVSKLRVVVDQLAVEVAPATAPRALQDRIMATVAAEAALLAAAGHGADRPSVRRNRWWQRPAFGLTAVAVLAAGVALGALVVAGPSNSTTKVPSHVTTALMAADAGGGKALLRQVGSQAELEVHNLPAPPKGRIYEVWLQHGDNTPQPTDALFSVTTKGEGSVAIPGDLHGVTKVLVTDEPMGGSLVPTRSPILSVAVAST